MQRSPCIAAICLLLASGCNRPLVVLTDATEDDARKAIGSMVEVEGMGSIGKDGDYVRAKNIGVVVYPARMPGNDRPVRVRGILSEDEYPYLGLKYFRIDNAEITPK
ncbi:MAG TPA: hypothetical protein VM165_23945 [Planctomycetaceae bacterium]|nr:hypothetical protein [Planctomycetaceae bacterium]